MAATPQDVLDIARSDLGYTESPPGSNRTKFGDWYGATGPWCAMYVSHAFYVAGLPLPAQSSKGFCYCPDGLDWFQQNGRLVQTPQIGDVVFYHFNEGHAGANHVGIVEGVGADVLTTLEGNTGGSDLNGGGVMRRNRPLGATVIGFGRPAYDAAAATTTTAGPPAPPPSFPAFPGRMLTLTSPYTTGNDVLQVQAQLHRIGIGGADGQPLKADGIFGPDTRASVKKLQTQKALPVDGIVGPVTWRQLWTAAPL
jgi:hypothetical protein